MKAESNGGSNSPAVVPKTRARLNKEQIQELEKHYDALGDRPNPANREMISRVLGISAKQVAHWFQNKRARKAQKETDKAEINDLRAKVEKLEQMQKEMEKELAMAKADIDRLMGQLIEERYERGCATQWTWSPVDPDLAYHLLQAKTLNNGVSSSSPSTRIFF